MTTITLKQLYDSVNETCKQTEKYFRSKCHKKFLENLTAKQQEYIIDMQLDHIKDLDLIVYDIGCMLGKEDNVT